MFRKRIAVDLGTTNTLIHVPGQGLVLDVPSVVAVERASRHVIAVGSEAKQFLGKTPQDITVVRPMKDGVIADFNAAGELLGRLLRQAIGSTLAKPDVLICVPLQISNVERRAVMEAALNAGVHDVRLISEPMAGAIGAGIDIHAPKGHMIVNIGGGTTAVAVISVGEHAQAVCLKCAGDTLTRTVQRCLREDFGLVVGENMAERAKIAIGSIIRPETPSCMDISGKALLTGTPKTASVPAASLQPALLGAFQPVLHTVRDILDDMPPELSGDIRTHGILLTGGGALLRGIPETLSEVARLPVTLDETPLSPTVRGAAIVANTHRKNEDILF